ncbi:MAG: hypothetical protein KAI70_04480 [Candidatus Omnitrophica bacterium]|nr:hypothetical protein [Candidatus Omnitrophota bacterium]
MRIHKIIVVGMIITMFSICYVHQRIEIIKAGYTLQESRRELSHLIDRNSKLMYNLSEFESPRYLLTSLNGEEIEFARHRSIRIDSYRLVFADPFLSGNTRGFAGRVLDALTLSAEAKPHK